MKTAVGAVSLSLLFTGLAVLTGRQTQRFISDETLWCHAVTVTPQRVRPLLNCAAVKLRQGDSDDAALLLDHAAVSLADPTRPSPQRTEQQRVLDTNRIYVLMARRQYPEAKEAAMLLRCHYPENRLARSMSTWFEALP